MPGGGKSTDRKWVRVGQARERVTVDGTGLLQGVTEMLWNQEVVGGGYSTLTVLDATDLCTFTR